MTEAKTLDPAALAVLSAELGEAHPASIVCAINLASDDHALQAPYDALHRDRDTLERARQTLGEEHPTTLACALNHALDLRATGAEDAKTRFSQAVDGLLKTLGPTHPDTVTARQATRADCDTYPIPV